MGADSYISRLTLEAKAMQNTEQSEMIRSLDKLVNGSALHHSNRDYFVYSGICISGRRVSIQCDVHDRGCDRNDPGRLYLLASVALAVSSIRLAQKKSIAA